MSYPLTEMERWWSAIVVRAAEEQVPEPYLAWQDIASLRAENRRLRLAIEAHQVQSVGWRPTTEVDRELWANGANEWSEVEP